MFFGLLWVALAAPPAVCAPTLFDEEKARHFSELRACVEGRKEAPKNVEVEIEVGPKRTRAIVEAIPYQATGGVRRRGGGEVDPRVTDDLSRPDHSEFLDQVLRQADV
jgi:hypothetical protein